MKHEPKVHLIGDRPICPVTIENLQSRGGHVYHTELTNTGKLRLLALPVLCLYYTAVRLLPPGPSRRDCRLGWLSKKLTLSLSLFLTLASGGPVPFLHEFLGFFLLVCFALDILSLMAHECIILSNPRSFPPPLVSPS